MNTFFKHKEIQKSRGKLEDINHPLLLLLLLQQNNESNYEYRL
jgi:hypothetical protein